MTICLFIDIGVPGTSKKLPVLSVKGQVFCCRLQARFVMWTGRAFLSLITNNYHFIHFTTKTDISRLFVLNSNHLVIKYRMVKCKKNVNNFEKKAEGGCRA